MEPKPTFTWKNWGRSRLRLFANDEKLPDYDIMIYRPYGSSKFPWTAVANYETDSADKITENYDLERVKRCAEKWWFDSYVEELT